MQSALKRRSAFFWLALMFFFLIGGPTAYRKWEAFRGETGRREAAIREIRWIGEALVAYKAKYGNYPRPIGGSMDPVDQAKMLYQAVTGDGTNFIDAVSGTPSDGTPGTDGDFLLEAAYPGSRRPSSLVHQELYLVDPWGHPYRYARGDEGPEIHNKNTFDLWSPGSENSGGGEERLIRNW